MFTNLTVSARPFSERPGPGNTGCRIAEQDLILWADHDKNYDNNDKIKIADTTIVGALFTGAMKVYAPRVTFVDCIFSGTLNGTDCSGPLYNLQTYDNSVSAMKVSHCTLTEARGTNLNIDKGVTTTQAGNSLGANNLIEYCNIGGNCQDSCKSNKGTTFYKSWIHSAGSNKYKPLGHGDLLQSVRPDGDLIIDQCYFDMKSQTFSTDKTTNPPDGNDVCNCYKVPDKKGNAAVIWKCERDDGGDCSGNVTIKDSWVNGGNYMLYHAMEQDCCDGGDCDKTGASAIDCGNYHSNYVLSGSTIGRDFAFGLFSADYNGTSPGNITGTRTFLDNKFEDGIPIADGTVASKYYNRYNCFFAAPGAYNECPGVTWPCSTPGDCTGVGCEECS